MTEKTNCPICQSHCEVQRNYDKMAVFYACPTCGRYELKCSMDDADYESIDRNQLAPYLFYHRFLQNSLPTEYRYHTTLSKDKCDNYKADFNQGNINNGNPVHMDGDIINAWYPKSFYERIDFIISFLGDHIPHIGQTIQLSDEESLSLLFIDRFEIDKRYISRTSGEFISRSSGDCITEANYMLDSLKELGFIEFHCGENYYGFQL